MEYDCRRLESGEAKKLKYVVVLSRYRGKIMLSRHRKRETWETQGGHIEAGETPLEAAKRELYEESGAVRFEMKPLFDYWAKDPRGEACGEVFLAQIEELGGMPESEMAEVRLFDTLPENLTYPNITPHLFRWAAELGVF